MVHVRFELHDDLVDLAMKARAAEQPDIELVLLVSAAYLAANRLPSLVNGMTTCAEALVVALDQAKEHDSLANHDLELLLRRVDEPRRAVAEAEKIEAEASNDWSEWETHQ
jgi:hypothetical protein